MAEYLTDEEFQNLALSGDLISDSSEAIRADQIQSASATANSYLKAAGYDPDFVTVDDDLKYRVAAIAAFRLAKKLQRLPEPATSSALYIDYKMALDWFEKVARGTIKPNLVDQTPEDEPSAGAPLIYTNEKRGW